MGPRSSALLSARHSVPRPLPSTVQPASNDQQRLWAKLARQASSHPTKSTDREGRGKYYAGVLRRSSVDRQPTIPAVGKGGEGAPAVVGRSAHDATGSSTSRSMYVFVCSSEPEENSDSPRNIRARVAWRRASVAVAGHILENVGEGRREATGADCSWGGVPCRRFLQ
jgi:hypothetical protein